jgi:hypothetical protein
MHIEDGVAKVCIESSSAWVSPAVPRMLNQLGAQHRPLAIDASIDAEGS